MHVDREITQRAGVSTKTVYSVRFLKNHGDAETIGRLRRGQLPISRAYKTVKRQVDEREPVSSPVVRPRGCQLIVGEALHELGKMESTLFDAVITDPPYGIGYQYGEEREEHGDPEAYGAWIKQVYAELLRVLKPGGFLAIFQSSQHFRYLWDWFGPEITIYAASKSFVQLRPVPINLAFDLIIVKYKEGAKPLAPRNPRRNLNHYLSSANPGLDPLGSQHPCSRPLDQMSELVTNFVVEGGHVPDAFCGSGTTGVACLEHGRSFDGIEVNERYANLAG